MENALILAANIAPFILVFAVFYFVLIRPQRKKDKLIQKMRNDIQIGDEIITSGGIVGIVVSIKEDTIVLETGGDRSKIRIKRWAVQSNETIHESADTIA